MKTCDFVNEGISEIVARYKILQDALNLNEVALKAVHFVLKIKASPLQHFIVENERRLGFVLYFLASLPFIIILQYFSKLSGRQRKGPFFYYVLCKERRINVSVKSRHEGEKVL